MKEGCDTIVIDTPNGQREGRTHGFILGSKKSGLRVEVVTEEKMVDLGGDELPVTLPTSESVEQLTHISSNIEIGGVRLKIGIGNLEVLFRMNSPTAKKLASILVDHHLGVAANTAQKKVTQLKALHSAPYLEKAEYAYSKFLESIGGAPIFKRNVVYSDFQRATFWILKGNEERAYKELGAKIHTAGDPADPLKFVREAASHLRDGYASWEKGLDINSSVAEKAGKGESYVPRVMSLDEANYWLRRVSGEDINGGLTRIGRELFAKAIEARTDLSMLTHAQKQLVGETYLKNMFNKANSTGSHSTFSSIDKEVEGVIKNFMAAGMDRDVAAKLALNLVKSADPATPGHLMHRIALDDNLSVDFTTPKGETISLSVSDLMNRDARGLFEGYSHQMSHYASMKELGLHDRAVMKELISAASLELSNAGQGHLIPEMEKRLDYMWHISMGYPPAANSNMFFDRMLGMMRQIATIKYMGKYVVSNTIELGNSTSYSLARGALKAGGLELMMTSLFRSIDEKPVNSALMRTIRAMGLVDVASPHHFIDDNLHFDGAMDKADYYVSKANQVHSLATGRHGFTNGQRAVANVTVMQNVLDIHNGIVTDQKSLDRVARMGFTQENVNKVLADFNKYTQKTDDGIMKFTDIETWVRENPDTYTEFVAAVKKEADWQLNAENARDMHPITGETLGKIFMQFRSWVAPMYQKKFVDGFARGDIMVVHAMIHSLVIGASVRYVNNLIQFANDKKRLEEENRMDVLLLKTWAQSGWLSLLPMVVNSGAKLTGHSITGLDNASYSGTNSTLTPAVLRLLSDIGKAGGAAVSMIGQGATKGNVKALVNAVTPNVVPNAALDALTEKLPTKQANPLDALIK